MNQHEEVELVAIRALHRRDVELYLRCGEWYAKGDDLLGWQLHGDDDVPSVEFKRGCYGVQAPILAHISENAAQRLMDQLYRDGFRPSEDQGGTGTIGAIQKHLEDMRAIAFEKVRVKKP